MREKNGRAKRYKESGGQFKHWKSPLPVHSKGTAKGSAFQCCFIALGKWFRHRRKAGLATVPRYCSSGTIHDPILMSQSRSGSPSPDLLDVSGRPATSIGPIAMFGNQSLKPELARLPEQIGPNF